MLDLDLTGKTALVCGSTQGIGKATAQLLAVQGASIVLLARNKQKLEQVIKELPASKGREHEFYVADFDHSDEVHAAAEKATGGNRVFHILVNNSGGPPGGLARNADPEAYRKAFDRHLIASQLLTQAVVPGMTEAEYGRIVNIISTSVKAPIPGLGVSNTIRGAMASWAKTLSREVGPFGITVNNILPGATNTGRLMALIDSQAKNRRVDSAVVREEMIGEIPAGRFATAEEIAGAVVFLCSPAAAYINGINLPVDGGRLSTL